MKRSSGSAVGAANMVLLALVTMAACGTNTNEGAPMRGNVDDARIIAAPETEPGSWLAYGQTYKEQRFSQLTQINRDNVDQLGLAWSKQIGDANMRMQGTPIVVDRVMYATNGWSVVYALDAATGAQIWRYDPEVDRSSIRLACCGPAHNRGVAVYKGKVYVGTFDGRLIAIDATTGELAWDVDTWHPNGARTLQHHRSAPRRRRQGLHRPGELRIRSSARVRHGL